MNLLKNKLMKRRKIKNSKMNNEEKLGYWWLSTEILLCRHINSSVNNYNYVLNVCIFVYIYIYNIAINNGFKYKKTNYLCIILVNQFRES